MDTMRLVLEKHLLVMLKNVRFEFRMNATLAIIILTSAQALGENTTSMIARHATEILRGFGGCGL